MSTQTAGEATAGEPTQGEATAGEPTQGEATAGEPTQGEATAEPEEEEKPPAKIFYCELCKIPCMSSITLQTHFAGLRHKKRERALKTKHVGDSKVPYDEPESVKRPIAVNIRSLGDFMKDPEREEPLVGMEYVVEIRFTGRKEPSYECQLCEFNTELVPMIEHLTGQRHRKSYLTKHHPDKVKRNPNEEKARFLRRIARAVEKEEGIKPYKRERYERPSVPSATAVRKKAKIGYKPKNDPARRRKALKYMNTFEITSDAEATLVINIAQTLSETLRAFCEKKAALVHIRSLPPLIGRGRRNAKQACNYEPTKPVESYMQGDKNCNLEDNWNLGDKTWNLGNLSNGVAQLKVLLQQASSTSHTPTDSYGSQMGRRVPSSGISSKDRATMSALQSSFTVQPGDDGCGIDEWMKQFNQSASVYFEPTSASEKSPYFTAPQSSYLVQQRQGNSPKVPNFTAPQSSYPVQQRQGNSPKVPNFTAPQSSYPVQQRQGNNPKVPNFTAPQSNYPVQQRPGNSPKVPNNRMPDNRIRNWDCMRDSLDSRAYPDLNTPISYPLPRGYQANYPSQGYPSWYGDGSVSGNKVSASFSSESTGWPQQPGYQQSNFRGDVGSYPSFSGNSSCSNYQQQDTQLNNFISGNSGLTANIMSQLRGKDAATLTYMLQQLVPHYPDLQKIDIHALAQVLSQMS